MAVIGYVCCIEVEAVGNLIKCDESVTSSSVFSCCLSLVVQVKQLFLCVGRWMELKGKWRKEAAI